MALNQNQEKAAKSLGSPTMIIAGPGTGKTRTLIARLEFLLLTQKVNPNSVLALTFTKKAANEIKQRLAKSGLKNLPFVGTFHSLANELLTKKGYEFEIASDTQIEQIIEQLYKNEKIKPLLKGLNKKDLLLLISKYKNSVNQKDPQIKAIVDEYDRLLGNDNLIDYDDLLILALGLIKDQQIKYDHVLIDEFQDTNDLQYQLLVNLISEVQDLFVIGDPQQSIYGFRGGGPRYFSQFLKDFSNVNQVLLKDNYRSGRNILKVSSRLFLGTKQLSANCDFDGKVCLVSTFNQYSEADWILQKINEKVGGIDLNFAGEIEPSLVEDNSFADFAVCFRTHNLAKVMESKFSQLGIPFQIIGADSLYERKTALFLKYCLQFLNTKDDNFPFLAKQLNLIDHPVSLIKQKLEAIDKTLPISQIINAISDAFLLPQVLTQDQLSDLAQFTASAVGFDKDAQSLFKFLDYLEFLETNEFYDPAADKVTLMTMHAAKGLEFPFVFIAGFEQGLIPYSKSESEEELEEEKRLFYVALTRAKQEVFLVSCLNRFGKTARVSEFKDLIAGSGLDYLVDPQIEKISKKIEKKKRQQLEFFSF